MGNAGRQYQDIPGLKEDSGAAGTAKLRLHPAGIDSEHFVGAGMIMMKRINPGSCKKHKLPLLSIILMCV